MKLVILSSSPHGRVATRFKDAAKERQLEVAVVSVDDAQSLMATSLEGTVILPRISPEQNDKTKVLAQLADAGARVINPAEGWMISRDKWTAYRRFIEAGVATPATMSATPGIFEGTAQLGKRAVYKPLHGTHGEGIVILEQGDIVPAEPGIIQEYIDTTAHEDIRLFVIGGKVVAAMKRTAKAGDFRANLHQGATATAYEPSLSMQLLAIKAAKSLGLAVAGVDILPSQSGGLVIEANPSPGLGIEAYVDKDIALAVIDAIIDGSVWS